MSNAWIGALAILAISSHLSAQRLTSESPSERLQPLVKASAQRINLARQVALAKWDSGAAVEDIPREHKVIETVSKEASQQGLEESDIAFCAGMRGACKVGFSQIHFSIGENRGEALIEPHRAFRKHQRLVL